MSLFLFPINPPAPVPAPVLAPPPAPVPQHSDVRRRIQHKAGPFREVIGGKATREYQIIELTNGTFWWEFTTGERVKAPPACTRVLIDDTLTFGMFAEVSA